MQIQAPFPLAPLSVILVASLALSGCLSSSSGSSSSTSTPPAVVSCDNSDSELAVQVNDICLQTFTLASPAQAANTPGTDGVTVSNERLLTHLGPDANLNQVRYTRYAPADRQLEQPDAILVAVPGTLGGAHNYLRLAENMIARGAAAGLHIELWGVDRRSTLLEDTSGLNLAEDEHNAELALDFLFGEELALELSPELDRRAVFYNQSDVPFMVNWTPQVHSIDINVVVEKAREAARNHNVFLGGHSAGTGFVARYAATDFDFTNSGTPDPGYAKVRGLVLFEGQGGSVNTSAPTDEELDAVIAAADGGMFQRALDGDISSYINAPGLGPRQVATTELTGMQMAFEGTINGSQSLLQQSFGPDRNGLPNNVYNQVPGFTPRPIPVTAGSAIGTFQDDDNPPDAPQFYEISMGALGGPDPDTGLWQWLDNDQPLPESALSFNGEAPTSVTQTPLYWGQEVEPTNLARLTPAFFAGGSNFSDWYYPSTGLLLGNNAATGGASLGLDSSALSLPVGQGGRGRSDIVNQTQARNIDIPVIGFGGSNGLVPITAAWRGFANSIAPCAAASCDGTTVRIPDTNPLSAFPTFGGVAGGFEVHISEGYSHNDVLTADDDETNNVVGPLMDFIERNLL